VASVRVLLVENRIHSKRIAARESCAMERSGVDVSDADTRRTDELNQVSKDLDIVERRVEHSTLSPAVVSRAVESFLYSLPFYKSAQPNFGSVFAQGYSRRRNAFDCRALGPAH
jgi:hypothetical protein